MGINRQKIVELITPLIESMGYCLWQVEIQLTKSRTLLRVYIDVVEQATEARGVSLDDCSKISRQIGAVLEVENLIVGRYTLEVSSPGIDRPLFTPEHYRRYIGKVVGVNLFQSQAGRKKVVGVIAEVTDTGLELLVDDEKMLIKLADISGAKLISDF